jgi:hypothetical protein
LPSDSAPPTSRSPLFPDLIRRFGQQDRSLLTEQWSLLQRLSGAIEHYIEARIDEQVARKAR